MTAGSAGCFVCEKHLGRIDVPGAAIEPKRHIPGIAEHVYVASETFP